MNIKKAYNFKEVSELVSCSGTLKKVSLSSLLDENYDAVINLLPNDNEHAVDGEKREIEKLGIHYEYIPVNWGNPQYSDFEAFEFLMNTLKGKKVHIHCAANFRATAFYAIYARRNHAWSSIKVSKFMGSIWQLSEYPIWDKFVSDYENS